VIIRFDSDPTIELYAGHTGDPRFPTATKMDLVFPGYLLLGVIPLHHWGSNRWTCSIDRFEKIESHKMHYRHKDIPNLWNVRQSFFDAPMFIKLLDQSPGRHFIIDRLSTELLSADFEDIDRDHHIHVAAGAEQARTGLLFTYRDSVRVFTDAYLPRDRQWVNESNSDSARPQFLVLGDDLIKPYP
jgi:hypothetical protein